MTDVYELLHEQDWYEGGPDTLGTFSTLEGAQTALPIPDDARWQPAEETTRKWVLVGFRPDGDELFIWRTTLDEPIATDEIRGWDSGDRW